jgi:hypothetical protein
MRYALVVQKRGRLFFIPVLVTALVACVPASAKRVSGDQPILQLCAEYSGSGDLLKASVAAHSFSTSIVRPDGRVIELAGELGDSTPASTLWGDLSSLSLPPSSSPISCQLAVSKSSKIAALAVRIQGGTLVELLDLTIGKITHIVRIPTAFPIQSPLQPIGFIEDSETLALSQAHYLPNGEPEISTHLISADGSVTPAAHNVTGAQWTEVSSSTFDFGDARMWFLCPAYSARIDRQPRCTLTSASLRDPVAPPREIPPPPDDRVIGSGQPNLGFPTPELAVVLAERRFWLYSFIDHSFRQLNLPETPHHIRWFEFPGPPKFSSDAMYAAVPIEMYHLPLFEEGQVPHGTKLLIIELRSLRIVQTIQPTDKRALVDFALRHDGNIVTLIANWGKDWQEFRFSLSDSHVPGG